MIHSTPWPSTSADCAHLQRDLVNLQESIRSAWKNLHTHVIEILRKDKSTPSSANTYRSSFGQMLRSSDENGEDGGDHVPPPSLMTQLPRHSGARSPDWQLDHQFFKSSNGEKQGPDDTVGGALGTLPHATPAKESTVVRIRLSSTAALHQAVPAGPACAPCAAAENKGAPRRATLTVKQQSGTCNETVRAERLRPEAFQTGAVNAAGPASRESRFSTRCCSLRDRS